MAGITPGKPVTSIEGFDVDAATIGVLTLDPPQSQFSQHLIFNHGYSLYVDNIGGGAANNRLWLDTPDDGQVVIGPRSGSAFIADLRFRSDATTATAANLYLDASTYRVHRSTSSRRYKRSIEDVEIDLDALRRLRPVRFHDRGEYEEQGDAAPWYVGLIAEEVHDLGLREFVSYMTTEEDETVPDGIQYDRIVVGLLQLVSQLEERVSALEAERTPV